MPEIIVGSLFLASWEAMMWLAIRKNPNTRWIRNMRIIGRIFIIGGTFLRIVGII